MPLAASGQQADPMSLWVCAYPDGSLKSPSTLGGGRGGRGRERLQLSPVRWLVDALSSRGLAPESVLGHFCKTKAASGEWKVIGLARISNRDCVCYENMLSPLSPEVALMQKYPMDPIDIYEIAVEEFAVFRNDIGFTRRQEFKARGALGLAK